MRWLVLRCVPLTLIFFAAQVGVLIWLQLVYPGEYADPFAPYEAMMPGQVITPEAAPCIYRIEYRMTPMTICRLQPSDGVFASVIAIIRGNRVNATYFIANKLYLGDIVRQWGKPDSIGKLGPNLIVSWDNQALSGTIRPAMKIERFNFMLPVASFAIGLSSGISLR